MNDVIFPDCVIDVLKEQLVAIDGVTVALEYELDPTSPNGAVGITFEQVTPVDHEMGGRGAARFEYTLYVEHLVKHVDREAGNREHRSVANAIRTMLYRDPDTRVALRQLKHIATESTERMMKWDLDQRCASNKVKESFYFVSGTTIIFETEIV